MLNLYFGHLRRYDGQVNKHGFIKGPTVVYHTSQTDQRTLTLIEVLKCKHPPPPPPSLLNTTASGFSTDSTHYKVIMKQ